MNTYEESIDQRNSMRQPFRMYTQEETTLGVVDEATLAAWTESINKLLKIHAKDDRIDLWKDIT